jgi:hypothetical protein
MFVNVFAPESRTGSSSDSRIGSSPKLALLTVEIPGFRMFVTPLPDRIKIPELCTFANSGLHRFQASENREFPAPEKHTLRTSLSSTFRGWRIFMNSPTSASAAPPTQELWINASQKSIRIPRTTACPRRPTPRISRGCNAGTRQMQWSHSV